MGDRHAAPTPGDPSSPPFGVVAAVGQGLAGLWFGLDAPTAAAAATLWRRLATTSRLPPAAPRGPVWVFPASDVLARSRRFVTRLGGGPWPDPWCTARFPALGRWRLPAAEAAPPGAPAELTVWLASFGPVPPGAVRDEGAP